ncbi:MAG TPA: Do family serine endopeptidase [Bryobacteraceae bacterium]|nr:Do family serine endopeptidase [Bryobacteraceae bacterium]
MKLLEKIRQQKLTSTALMLFTLSVGIVIGTLINTQVNAARGQSVAPDATPLTVPKASEIGNEFTKLAKKVEPTVVNITVEVTAKPSAGARIRPSDPNGDDDSDDLFRRFFGGGPGQQGQQLPPQAFKHEQSGTGFIVDKNGYIVTNNHVVEGGDKIRVKLHGDSNEYRAKLIGTDRESDLAVLKIDAKRPLQTITIGNSDGMQVGDWTVAIGSPFGLEETVTAGIVSATGRDIDGAQQFQHFIQTDAAINPGNSGGPLLNIRGEVIGVNTMIATSRGGSEGVGFALPVNMVVRVYNDIIKEGRVTRGSIGIQFTKNTKPETLAAAGFDHGVIVESIHKDGPAERAGLKPEDIILSINGQPVKDGDDLVSRVSDMPIGTVAKIEADRDGKKMEFNVTIRDRMEVFKDDVRVVGENTPPEDTSKPEASNVKFGIGLRDLTSDERNQAPDKRGVIVTRVEPDSFAEDIGFMKGDIITAINRQPVNSPDDVRKIQQPLKPGAAVDFRVVRIPQGVAGTRAKGSAGAAAAVLHLAGTLPAQ